jgi:hypothetical protein
VQALRQRPIASGASWAEAAHLLGSRCGFALFRRLSALPDLEYLPVSDSGDLALAPARRFEGSHARNPTE